MDRAATRTNPTARGVHAKLAACLVLAACVRLAAWALISPTGLVNDEVDYHLQAELVSQGAALGDAGGRPPGVILLYAALYRIFGASPQVARGGNVALDLLCVALVFAVGRAFGGARVGLLAALLASLYPTFIGFSHSLWSEPLYLACALSALWAVLAYERRPAPWRLGVAGIAFGLGALTREIGLPTAVAMAAWLGFAGRPGLRVAARRAALVLAPTFAVLLPWSAKLYAESGHLAFSSTTTWFNLYVGNAGRTMGEPWLTYPTLGETRAQREAAAKELALAAIRKRLPEWPVEKLAELRDLLAPDSFTMQRLAHGPGSPRPLPSSQMGSWGYVFRFDVLNRWAFRRLAILACLASYATLLLLGCAGLVLAPNRRAAGAFAVFGLAHVLPTLAAFALTRHRLPLMPLLAISTAGLLNTLPACWRDAGRPRRLAALASVAAAGGVLAWGRGAMPL